MSEYKTPFSEAIEENEKLLRRVQAAEKLLKGFTATDLCGANSWAYDACDELLNEFWEIEDDAAAT
jgi:hypothetical protein